MSWFKGLFGQKETENSDKKTWGIFDSLKFWDNDKEKETSDVMQSTKSELNSMYANLMIVAQKLWVSTKLKQEDFDDGTNDKDDHWYEFLDSSKEDVKKLLTDISTSISKSTYASTYSGLIKNIESYKDWSGKRIEWIKKAAWRLWLEKIYTKITEWIWSNDALNSLLKVDMDKILSNINTDLSKLAWELQWWAIWSEWDHEDHNNHSSSEQITNFDSIKSLRWKLSNPFGTWGILTWLFWEKRTWHNHAWVDFVKEGKEQELFATHRMKIIKNEYQDGWAGNYVKAQMVDNNDKPIRIEGKDIFFNYFHLSHKPNVKIWEIIDKNRAFAKEWNTGASRWEHLHFEIQRWAEKIDPLLAFDPSQFRFKQNWKIVAFDQRKKANNYQNRDQAA